MKFMIKFSSEKKNQANIADHHPDICDEIYAVL